jgi:small GTP-binding protein
LAQVVLLGDTFTGKTSLVLRFAEGYYRESARSPTVGAFFITKRLTIPSSGLTAKIQIWDTSGQDQFRPLAPMYYQGAAAAILCYDPTCPRSLETLKYWLDELHRNVPAGRLVIALAACKCDLIAQQSSRLHQQQQPAAESTQDGSHQPHQQQCTNKLQIAMAGLQEVEELAAHMGAIFVPTSAKNNDNVTELFAQVAERVLQVQKNNSKSPNNSNDIAVTMGGHRPLSPRASNNNTSPPSSSYGTNNFYSHHSPQQQPHATMSSSPSSPSRRSKTPYSSTSLHSTVTAPTTNHGTTTTTTSSNSNSALIREDYLHRRNHHHADHHNTDSNNHLAYDTNTLPIPSSPSRLYSTTDPNRMQDSPILARPMRSPNGGDNTDHHHGHNQKFSAATMCGDTEYLNCAALPQHVTDQAKGCVIL